METYLVGGAVRDEMLGRAFHERDYVVVGSTPEEMLKAGFRPVGKDFPVFLHPRTNEEYALARTERKTGPGHQGFDCYSDPDVTLEEDLLRRDLTINAMARDDAGHLIDPYGGQQDLSDKLLRHASPAFAEDPLRILRLARFKASLHHLDFTVNDETLLLVKEMVVQNQLEELAAERILAELDKALITNDPAQFFRFLYEVGAHERLWPEIPAEAVDLLADHPEISHIESRFSLLLCKADGDGITSLCERLKCTRSRSEVTGLVAGHFSTWTRLAELDAVHIVEFIQQLDAIRRQDRFDLFNQVCTDIASAINPDGNRGSASWIKLRDIVASVKARDLNSTETGAALGEAVTLEQIIRVQEILDDG